MTEEDTLKPEIVATSIGYPESPLWYRGALWFSDLQRRVVSCWNPDTGLRDVGAFPGKPGGLSADPQGLLVAEMETRTLHRLDHELGSRRSFADLSGVAVGQLNDLVIGHAGTTYVGNFGYDLAKREKPRPAPLWKVNPKGDVSVAAVDLLFANGMATSVSGRTLLVAETPAQRITSFSIADDGALLDRRIFADLDRRSPDGICVDSEDGVWFGSPFTEEFVRLDSGGAVTHVVPTPGRWAISCAFGGPDSATLFLTTAETSMRRFHADQSEGFIEVLTPEIPGPRQTLTL